MHYISKSSPCMLAPITRAFIFGGCPHDSCLYAGIHDVCLMDAGRPRVSICYDCHHVISPVVSPHVMFTMSSSCSVGICTIVY